MSDMGVALGRRLRELREQRRLTQAALARALGIGKPISVPAISSWETQSKIPPINRIEAYARFFATPRSAEGGALRLLADDDLTAEERRQRVALLEELTELRRVALSDGTAEETESDVPAGFWHFVDERPVTIVYGVLPPDLRAQMPYGDPDDPDYVEAYTYTDVDALIELHGHIRAVNSMNHAIRFKAADTLLGDDYTTHLVLLGGVDFNSVTRDVLRRVPVPVRQLARVDANATGAFEVTDTKRTFVPQLVDTERGKVLLEDVAHFVRAPNPFNKKRTVTICNGMFGRGTYGAARALTDERFRDRNEEHLTERFDPDIGYSILMRVQIVNGKVLTPDWTQAETRLHEWPKVAP